MNNEFDDYCDLDPSKICDNCCRCLEPEQDYRMVLADFAPEAGEPCGLSAGDEAELCEDGEVYDGSSIPLPYIDPKLKAEWEAILAQQQDTRLPADLSLKHGKELYGVRMGRGERQKKRPEPTDYNN